MKFDEAADDRRYAQHAASRILRIPGTTLWKLVHKHIGPGLLSFNHLAKLNMIRPIKGVVRRRDDPDGPVTKITIDGAVTVDPMVADGLPCISGTDAVMKTVIYRYRVCGDSIAFIARDYGVGNHTVSRALAAMAHA